MEKKLILPVLVLLSTTVTSCTSEPYTYGGDYPAVYSVVLNTIPETRGYSLFETYLAPEIDYKESDDFGRELFLYYEGNNVSAYSLVIVQYSNSNEAYYYPYLNFISSESNDFSEEEIANFKLQNDWNTEIQLDKCSWANIISRREDSPLTYAQIKSFYEAVLPGEEHFSDDRWIRYFKSDNYGRSLYTVEARLVSKWVIMLFQPDGPPADALILTDFYSYQSLLKTFLERNHWDEPL